MEPNPAKVSQLSVQPASRLARPPRECLLIAVDPLLEVSLAIWRKISRIEAIKRQLDSLLPPFGIYHSLGGVETRGARKFVDRERCTIWGDLV
jgi:hypothetical protein